MNARHTLLAMFALSSLAASAFAQDWTSEATYTKTVTTTTVTTYTPSYQATGYVQPWNNAPDAAPAYAPAPQPQPTAVQANYIETNYVQHFSDLTTSSRSSLLPSTSRNTANR